MDQIVFDQVSYVYNAGTPFERAALHDLNLAIPKGQVTAIIGHTGSGKSTLIQHLNVLLRPTKGTVRIGDQVVRVDSKNKNLQALRKKVGVVFQFPEAQLFEETVLADVMFGPLNFGASPEEAEAIARQQLEAVGIAEELYDRSPFDLSGGQMRRVAIAGVLALEPEVLVLDEPTAGLDPKGQQDMMTMFMNLQQESRLTLVLVTHQMEDVVAYADYVLVMEKGRLLRDGSVRQVFADAAWLEAHHLALPQSLAFAQKIHSPALEGALSQALPLDAQSLAQLIKAVKEKEEAHV